MTWVRLVLWIFNDCVWRQTAVAEKPCELWSVWRAWQQAWIGYLGMCIRYISSQIVVTGSGVLYHRSMNLLIQFVPWLEWLWYDGIGVWDDIHDVLFIHWVATMTRQSKNVYEDAACPFGPGQEFCICSHSANGLSCFCMGYVLVCRVWPGRAPVSADMLLGSKMIISFILHVSYSIAIGIMNHIDQNVWDFGQGSAGRHRSATVAILSAALLQRQTGAEISVWLPTYDGFLVEEEVVWFHVTVSLKGQSRGGHKKTFVSSVSFLQNSGLSLTPWKCQIFRGTSMKFWKSCWSMSRMHCRSTRSSLSRLLLGCWIVL